MHFGLQLVTELGTAASDHSSSHWPLQMSFSTEYYDRTVLHGVERHGNKVAWFIDSVPTFAWRD
jgi:hypothetical protein